ncbi:MAG: HDOD domain-containing protein [Curvibacter sp.]
MELNALLASPIVLPSIPKIVALLLSELDREVPDLKNITQLIGTDPALTTRVLQTANSSMFRLSGKVHSAAEALALLDLAHIRQMAAEAASSASLKGIPGMNLPQFWAYSLNVAKLARSLAGVTRQNQGAAFTCGLIHAIGELVMHAGMAADMTELNRELGPLDLKRAKAEMLCFGYNYAHVGGAYARQWRFPQSIVDALEHQYAPFANNVYEPLAGVIHLATWRARAKEARLSDKALAVSFPGEVGEVLDLDIDMVLQQDPFDWSSFT